MRRKSADAARENQPPTHRSDRQSDGAGSNGRSDPVTSLHRMVGNRTVGRLLADSPGVDHRTAPRLGRISKPVVQRQEGGGTKSKPKKSKPGTAGKSKPGKPKPGKSGKSKSGKAKSKPGKAGKSGSAKAGSKLPKGLKKTAEGVNDYILKHYGKLIEGSLKRSSIAGRIRYYDSKEALVKAKYQFAQTRAKRIVAQMSKAEKAKRKKASSVINSDVDIQRTLVPQIFGYLGGNNVPAFTDTHNGVIHTSSDGAVTLAHEILHYYSSTSNFRQVFGTGLDEGMTQYLAKEVYWGYRKAEGDEEEKEDDSSGGIRSRPRFDSEPPDPIPISELSAYSDEVKVVERIIESGVKEKTLEKAYFGGKPGLLKKLDKQTKPIREQIQGAGKNGKSTGKDGQDAGDGKDGKPSGGE